MPHRLTGTAFGRQRELLELGGQSETGFDQGYVCTEAEGTAPGPIMVLLGCETAVGQGTALVSLASSFRRKGASIVISSLGPVIARQAPQMAAAFLTALAEAIDEPDTTLGQVLLRAKRTARLLDPPPAAAHQPGRRGVEGRAPMLSLEMLPADRGDSLLIEYGRSEQTVHRVLIDGGHMNGYQGVKDRLLQVPPDEWRRRRFELLVVTHIDADHIDGVIALLQDPDLNCWFDDVWLNGWRHLLPLTDDEQGTPVPDPVTLGPKQGEFLGALLELLGQPWNRYFAGRMIFVPDEGALPRLTLTGGLKVTLLSPPLQQLRRLRRDWIAVVGDAAGQVGAGSSPLERFARMLTEDSIVVLGNETDRSTLDNKAANGSSIAFLIEFERHRLLMAGDALPDVLRLALSRWLGEQPDHPDRLRLDVFKLPYHGSDKNLTPQLMGVISCPNYLVSTNGAGNARHPDVETLAIIRSGHHGESGEGKPTVRLNYVEPHVDLFRIIPDIETIYGEDSRLAWGRDSS